MTDLGVSKREDVPAFEGATGVRETTLPSSPLRRSPARSLAAMAALAALAGVSGCGFGAGDASVVVHPQGRSDRVSTVQDYASLVREHQRGIRAEVAAVDGACPFTSAARRVSDDAASACLTALHQLSAQARQLTLALEHAGTGGDPGSSGSPPRRIAVLVEMTRSAASTYAQDVEALGSNAECLTTDGLKCEQLRLALASASSDLMAQLDAWAART
jgi:hypothetical protein